MDVLCVITVNNNMFVHVFYISPRTALFFMFELVYESSIFSYIFFSYAKTQVESGNDEYKLKYPHDVIIGMNHAQFCTGTLPPSVQELWIEPEVSDDESRQLTANSIAPFINYYSTV